MKQLKIKNADNDYSILELIKKRWSPVVFDKKPIEANTVLSVFEAARWAPSSRNEQPWRYIYGHRNDEVFNKILNTLMAGNIVWAKNAAVLIASFAKKNSGFNGKPLRHNFYDTGAANMLLQLQALEYGIYSHTMGGFSPEKISKTFDIPDSIEPVSVIALGYLGNVDDENSDDLKNRDLTPREREKITELIINPNQK